MYVHTIPYHTIPYHSIAQHSIHTYIQYRTAPYRTLHYTTLHYNAIKKTPQYIQDYVYIYTYTYLHASLQYVCDIHYIRVHQSTLQYITSHSITSHQTRLDYIPSHHISSHYISHLIIYFTSHVALPSILLFHHITLTSNSTCFIQFLQFQTAPGLRHLRRLRRRERRRRGAARFVSAGAGQLHGMGGKPMRKSRRHGMVNTMGPWGPGGSGWKMVFLPKRLVGRSVRKPIRRFLWEI